MIVYALFCLAFLLLLFNVFLRFIYIFHIGVHSSCSLMCNSIVWIYENFLIHSNIDGNLSSFHFGPGKHMDSFLLHIHLGVELMHHRICVCSSIEDTVKQFPERITTTFLWIVYKSSGCFMSLSTLDIECLFYFGYSGVCIVLSHCGFNKYFKIIIALSSFSYVH